jgi:alpha-L-rhamnosidase
MTRQSRFAVTALVAVSASITAPAHAALTVSRLRCEYKTNPLAIDLAKPRLSWIVESKEKGQKQTAYQIMVGTAPGKADLWDTGKVLSDETIQIPYDGQALESGQQAFWQVKVWDARGKSSVSSLAHWTKGLGANDWKAQWIQAALPKVASALPPITLEGASWIWLASDPENPPVGKRSFRVQFDAPTGASARIALTADNSYAVAVNGKNLATAKGSDWKVYNTYDLKDLLVAGANTVVVTVTNEGDAPNPAGLIAKLVVNGKEYPTGKSWEGSVARRAWEPVKILGAAGMAPWGKAEPGGSGNNAMTPPPHFRNTFRVEKPVKRALLYATALGVYELGLNGKPVSDDVFSPGWTEYKKRVHYLTYDVTKQLTVGANELQAQLGDGWYASYLAFTGRRRYYEGDPRLKLQLNIEYTDGTTATVGTGQDWQWAYGQILTSDMLMGEEVDTRKTATDWKPVQTLTNLPIAVEAHPGEPIRPAARIAAIVRTEPKKGTFVYNLGQNLTGWAKLTVTGKPGQMVTVRHAERLNPDGTAYFTNLRAAKATDTYILKGGTQVLEPKFTFHGFQYVEITGLDTAPAPKDVVGVAVHSTMADTLTFDSDNKLLNKLTDNIDWGFRGNALDVPTDCPQRDERAGWTGDAQVFAKTAMLNRDTASFFTKWLVDLIEDGQGADGALPDVAPYLSMVGRGNAAWEDAGVVVTYRMYEMYKDTQAIQKHWAGLTRFMEHLNKVAPDGIRQVGAYGDWLLLDEPQKSAIHGTAYYFYCAKLMAVMAEAIGKPEEAKAYQALAEKVKVAFNAKFVGPNGEVTDNGKASQTFYALALGWELLPKEKRAGAQKQLEGLLAAKKNHLATGFIGTPVLLFALDGVGRTDLANQLVLNDDYPSWLYQVKLGSTTMWERWDGWTPEKGFQNAGMNSFNHYWLGCVSEWLTTGLVGIDTDGPGWKKLTIKPRFNTVLNHASASYDSIRGKVSASWKKSGGSATVNVTIPANTTARLELPGKTENLSSGTYTFTVKLP